MFAPFLLVHERVGKPEQFFKRRLMDPRHMSDANAQREARDARPSVDSHGVALWRPIEREGIRQLLADAWYGRRPG